MKKVAIGGCLFVLFYFSFAHAQGGLGLAGGSTRAQSVSSPWYFGGNIGFSLWNNYSQLGVYPLVGYKVTSQFSVGGKAGYVYTSDDRYKPLPSLDTSNYGGSVFSRYRIIPQIYAHAEFAYWSYESVTSYTPGDSSYVTERNWVPYLLLGGGLSQRLGGNTYAFVEVLFDVIQDEKSPYDDWEPRVSVGISVGF